MRLRSAILAGAAFASGPWSVGAAAQVASFDAAQACAAIRSPKLAPILAAIPDAPTTIVSARVVPAGGDGSLPQKDLPEICRVEGMIAPSVGFLLRMPTRDWNGKFMMGGCGGPCGNYLEDRIDPGLVRKYAVVTTDLGHKGEGWSFGYHNVRGLIDFGYRATHVTAVAAKEIVAAYYGERAKHNYFNGCSTGGRQALTEAERFPRDFEGIIGGAPPLTQTRWQALVQEWASRNNVDRDGKPILTAEKLPMIHAAVLAACDALDGWKDGVLQNPLACKWEPKQIECKGGDAPNCLTAAQVGVVEKIYYGATWPDGRRMFLGNSGRARGTELKWNDLLPMAGDSNSQYKYWDEFGTRGPGYDDRTFDVERDLPGLAMTEVFFEQLNPDLRNFKELGGKFVFFGGWDDGCCRAQGLIDFYETVTRVMGGLQSTQEFFRLFLLAGMDHCRGGIGGGEADWITALENWVEKGQAPDMITAYHLNPDVYPTAPRALTDYGAPYMRTARHPLAKSEYDRAHPVYPYPDWPRWTGRGDPTDPATWSRVKGKLLEPGAP